MHASPRSSPARLTHRCEHHLPGRSTAVAHLRAHVRASLPLADYRYTLSPLLALLLLLCLSLAAVIAAAEFWLASPTRVCTNARFIIRAGLLLLLLVD